MILQHISQLMI